MTVGGSTRGRVVIAATGAFRGDEVLASHHARGVPTKTNSRVTTPAKRIVKKIAVISASENSIYLVKGFSIGFGDVITVL